MKQQNLAKKPEVHSLKQILPETLASIKNLRNRLNNKEREKVFFVKIGDARILRIRGAKKIVVLVNSTEEANSAISEGFLLALREYFWTAKNEERFHGFQFFVSSAQEAEKIKKIVPSHGRIPKKDNCRVNFCAMNKNVSLRWLASRFVRQTSLVF